MFNELLFTGETYLTAGSDTGISSVLVAGTSAPEPRNVPSFGIATPGGRFEARIFAATDTPRDEVET